MSQTEHTAPPAGTGNAPGLGEAFNINLSTGQGTYVYQMPLPEGVARHTPTLRLEYAHGGGQGPFGLGWQLPLRTIRRRLDYGTPEAGLVEHFIEGGTELVPLIDGIFGALRESAFHRYTRVGDGWRMEERKGAVHEMGLSAGARLADPAHPDRPIEWLIERTLDTSGNVIAYDWLMDQGTAYLRTIRYAIYEVRFHYDERPDARSDGHAGYLRRRALRCSHAELVIDPGPTEQVVRSWAFDYDHAPGSAVSLLSAIRLNSHGLAPNGSQDIQRPTIRFQYSNFDPRQFTLRWMDGQSPPPPLTERETALVTLDNAPLPGILSNRAGRQVYWANQGDGRWSEPRPLRDAPLAPSFASSGLAFVDMDGSGTADLMVAKADTVQGYYENEGSAGFGAFVAFPRSRRSVPRWTDANLRLLDADGDGLVDALASGRRAFTWWRNDGRQGWASPITVPKVAAGLQDIDLGDPDVHLADMNGDGLPDIVRVQSGRVEYWPGLGRGRYGERVVMQGAPRLQSHSPNDTIVLLDVDGDGCADLAYFSANGLTIYQNQNGARFAPAVVIPGVPPPIHGTVRPVNMRGQAGTGLLWNSRTAREPRYVQLEFGTGEPPYLLAHVENGAGLVSELYYRSAIEDYQRDRREGQTWTTNFPFPYMVVARTRETDQVSGRVVEVEFRYHEAHFEPHTRQFQGFRRTERLDRGDASRPDTLQTYTFLMAQERLPGKGPQHANLNGMLSRVETYGLDGSPTQGRPYRVETSDYGLTVLEETPDGRRRSFVFVLNHRVEDSERTDDTRVEEKIYTYDAVGNVLREALRGSGTRHGTAQPVLEQVTEVEYAASDTHLLNRPARVIVRDGAGRLRAEKRLYYDGPDFVGLPPGRADRGLCTREESWVLTQDDFNAHYTGMNQATLGYLSATNTDGVPSVFTTSERRRYDASGLLLAQRDALGNETRFAYDPGRVFRTQMTDALGTTRFAYDRATAQIAQTTYADGASTHFAYDAQGRVLASSLPGQALADAATTYEYDETQVPNKRVARFRQADGMISLGVTYFDGYGKEFQQRVEVEPGRVLVSGLKLSNPWGDVRQEFEPTYAATLDFALPDTAGRPSRRFTYDARGRVVRAANYNDGVSTAEYFPFRVILRDANDTDASAENVARGQFDTPRVEEFDSLRNLTRVTQVVSADASVVTEFEIGPQGELLAVSDGRGTKFRYRYDGLGNRLSIQGRESGERKLWYDGRRKVVRTLDGASHDLRATWDAVGRLLQLVIGATVLEQYSYDTAAQHAFGRLAEVRYIGGRQVFTYDAGGRLMQRAYFYDGQAAPHTLSYEYDPLGRETAVIHTDGTRIDRRLLFNGWLQSIQGVVQAIQYDPRGLPLEVAYQNGVRTTYACTPGPGRIQQQTTTGPSGEVLEQIAYTFDQMEVMLSSDDQAPGGVGARRFSYDPLYQLTGLQREEAGNPVQDTYHYADDYNLSRLDEARCTLHYDDGAHPDRVHGLTPDGGVRFAIPYDGNGNLLGLPEQQFAYDAKNELARFTRADGLIAEYRYDHMGLRMSKRVDDGHGNVSTTLYVSDLVEVRNGVPAYIVRVGSMRAAIITQGTTLFLHENSTGSTAFFTDVGGQRVGQLDTRPFGNVASRSGAIDFETFSLHPRDAESGLVYMRRRYYSPLLGRFLTPDLLATFQPEKFLHTPQALHLYAFVANDPMNKADPTGMSFWSVVGGIVGAVVGVVVAVAIVAAVVATGGLVGIVIGVGLALAAGLAVTGVSYIIASNVDPNSAFGQFMRGFMIGFNAGMNGVLAGAIFGPVVGVALGVINFLAVFDGIAQNSVYQGILGWSNWFMPMSWPIAVAAVVVFAFNLVVAGITFQQWDAAKIDKLAIDWKTGSIIMVGGLIRNGTAFNMGNFVFVDPGAIIPGDPTWDYDQIVEHEAGHTLSVAAFGTAFHIADFFGENVFGGGTNDYGELIAESHVSGGVRPTIPVWG